jgi:hypothetical protein
MDVEFDGMLREYAELEGAVQKVIGDLFGQVCAHCTSSCCTPDICEESLESAFLRVLRERFCPQVYFCDRYGWLGASGCCLDCGRPPVCYGFFCNAIVDSLPDERCELVRELGRIVAWVGERASGSLHLVEIMDSEELSKINCFRVLTRIAEGRQRLDRVRQELFS